mgnify:CR=1 FL=1
MDIKELAESYFVQKDGIKRHQILLKITFQCEYASKEFFEKAFKKERKLEEKLTALRGIAFFATEQEVEIYANKLLIAVMKVPQTTPYAYNLYEDMRAAYLLPYLVKNSDIFSPIRSQAKAGYACSFKLIHKLYNSLVFRCFFRTNNNGEAAVTLTLHLRISHN